MAKVKLTKGRSYMYKDYVFEETGDILDVKTEDAAYLLGTGAFEAVETAKKAPTVKASEPKTEKTAETKAKKTEK